MGYGLADVAVLANRLECWLRRNRQCRGIPRQFSIVGAVAGRGMGYLVVDRPHLFHGHLPAGRGGLAQHQPSARSRLPQAVVVSQDALRAVGVLVTVFGVTRCLIHRDARPVRFQFVGDDLRQRGAHALAHLRAMRRDAHGAVRPQGEEQVGLERNGRLRLRVGGRHRQTSAEHERTGRAQEMAAGEIRQRAGGGWRGGDSLLVHHLTPRCAGRRLGEWRRECERRCRNGRCCRPSRRRCPHPWAWAWRPTAPPRT